MVESRQRGLNWLADGDMEVKSHFIGSRGNSGNSETNQDVRTILQIPNALFLSFLPEQKKAFLYWKNSTVNSESVTNKEIMNILKQEDLGSKQTGQGKGNKCRKGQAVKAWRTEAQICDTL
eukprot:1187565-Ditylum_brightwellii.AAC.1